MIIRNREVREGWALHDYRIFEFDFDHAYRAAGLALGITPSRSFVIVTAAELTVRFGWWLLSIERENIRSAQITGPYALIKTLGPPRLSFVDRGLTMATNGRRGICLKFIEPVSSPYPGAPRHPGLTLTLKDCEGLRALLTSEATQEN
jgi:hypothetical protein